MDFTVTDKPISEEMEWANRETMGDCISPPRSVLVPCSCGNVPSGNVFITILVIRVPSVRYRNLFIILPLSPIVLIIPITEKRIMKIAEIARILFISLAVFCSYLCGKKNLLKTKVVMNGSVQVNIHTRPPIEILIVEHNKAQNKNPFISI